MPWKVAWIFSFAAPADPAGEVTARRYEQSRLTATVRDDTEPVVRSRQASAVVRSDTRSIVRLLDVM